MHVKTKARLQKPEKQRKERGKPKKIKEGEKNLLILILNILLNIILHGCSVSGHSLTVCFFFSTR